jgi:hypothetical protein
MNPVEEIAAGVFRCAKHQCHEQLARDAGTPWRWTTEKPIPSLCIECREELAQMIELAMMGQTVRSVARLEPAPRRSVVASVLSELFRFSVIGIAAASIGGASVIAWHLLRTTGH